MVGGKVEFNPKGQKNRPSSNTQPKATIDMTVSSTVQVRSASGTDKFRYSLTSQNPPSFTCESRSEPEPIAKTSNSRFVPGWASAIGFNNPAAVVMATVAEPV